MGADATGSPLSETHFFGSALYLASHAARASQAIALMPPEMPDSSAAWRTSASIDGAIEKLLTTFASGFLGDMASSRPNDTLAC